VANRGKLICLKPRLVMLMFVVQNELPRDVGNVDSIVLPVHLWLDKGNMTRRVQLHPIVLRAAWIDSLVRNGSGNGGGCLIGFMPMVLLITPERRCSAHATLSSIIHSTTRTHLQA
jgi:hypothetical protein